MKFKTPKIKSVTLKAAIISGVFLIISQLIPSILTKNSSPSEDIEVRKKEELKKEVLENNDIGQERLLKEEIIQPVEEKYEPYDFKIVNGNDVDLVQLKLESLKSNFHMMKGDGTIQIGPKESFYEAIHKNKKIWDSIVKVLEGKEDKDTLQSDEAFFEKVHKLMPVRNELAPILDITLFNKSKNKLILSNVEIEIIYTPEEQGSGGAAGDFIKNDGKIESEYLYNIGLPFVHSVFDDSFYCTKEDSLRLKIDTLKSTTYEKIHSNYFNNVQGVRDTIFIDKIPLEKYLEYEKINAGFAHIKPFEYNLTPPLSFPSQETLRFKLRFFNQFNYTINYFFVLKLKFYGSKTYIKIPIKIWYT